MLTDGVLLGLAFSGALLALGAWKGSRPVVFVSSLGWTVCGLQIVQQTEELLPLALLVMLAISQFILVGSGGRSRWS